MKEITLGFEKQKELHLKNNEESSQNTDALIEALTEKSELEAKYEKLKHEREELETEFYEILDSKVKEYEEKLTETNSKLIQSLTDKQEVDTRLQELKDEFQTILESKLAEIEEKTNAFIQSLQEKNELEAKCNELKSEREEL
jgi:DNA repair exonuclease SbcCD ATPase subunit